MSDVNTVNSLIEKAKTHMIAITYERKDGTKGEGVFLAKVTKHSKGGESTTAHIPYYKTLFNVQKKRYSKIDMRKIKRMKFDGQEFNFC